MVPTFVQIYLLGRVSGTLRFRSDRVAFAGALLTTLGYLLCKTRLPHRQLNRAPVVRLVISHATIALKLFPRGRASVREVRAPHTRRTGAVSAFTLHVSETLATFVLQWAYWAT
jgi:hypothetical protein